MPCRSAFPRCFLLRINRQGLPDRQRALHQPAVRCPFRHQKKSGHEIGQTRKFPSVSTSGCKRESRQEDAQTTPPAEPATNPLQQYRAGWDQAIPPVSRKAAPISLKQQASGAAGRSFPLNLQRPSQITRLPQQRRPRNQRGKASGNILRQTDQPRVVMRNDGSEATFTHT